jgi:hypothetical protein
MWVKMVRSRPESSGMFFLRQGLYNLPEKLALRFIHDGDAILPGTDDLPTDGRERKIIVDQIKR